MRCNQVASFGGWFSPATFTCVCVLIAAAIGRAAEPMAAGGGEKTAQAGDIDITPHPGMLRYPDVSGESIVFVYANDLWLVPRAGGTALPLSSPAGQELHPKFSADGSTIAFVANYEGNQDLYTMQVEGGVPTRVTHHPAGELVCDWTNEGRILFSTNGLANMQRQTELYDVEAKGGLPRKLAVPYGAN